MGLKRRGTTGHALSAPGLALLILACLTLPVACTSAEGQARVSVPTVQVTERDFHISAPKSVPTGDLSLHVTNQGPDWHELIIVRASGRLPLRGDGLTVNEEALDPVIVGALEPGEAGARDLHVHLTAGRYQFFCNMAGHFMAGMYGTIVAR
jgi:hypothetical protein